ncbi:MAG: zf-HC2 domain-containing protein [Candidatus Aminicenantes bacterium]|nr:zf-HC2 domain-containing protein [Candidatus Aminicenantes bacterium]
MNCRECRRLIAVSLYAELPAEERSSLEEHIRNCPDCRAALKKTPHRLAEAFPHPATTESPDWEKSWAAVSDRLNSRIRRSPRLQPRPAWAFAGLILLAVFIAGYFAGRSGRMKIPGFSSPQAAGVPSAIDSAAFLQGYAESLHPLLTSWLHRSARDDSQEASPLERQLVQDMLTQTRILRDLAARQGDPYLTDLARDIETLLLEIAGLRPGEGGLPERLTEWAEARRLQVKVRILAAPGPRI